MHLREHLQDIYVTNGRLTPALVVDAARSEASPLHGQFEWDDTVAGEKYREVQARTLIRSAKISYVPKDPDDNDRVRAFHAVTRPEGPTYMPIEEIADDPFTRELVLRNAEREWRALHKRYAHLSEFLAVVRADVAASE